MLCMFNEILMKKKYMDNINNKNNSMFYINYNEVLLSFYFIKNFNINNIYKLYKKIWVIVWNVCYNVS